MMDYETIAYHTRILPNDKTVFIAITITVLFSWITRGSHHKFIVTISHISLLTYVLYRVKLLTFVFAWSYYRNLISERVRYNKIMNKYELHQVDGDDLEYAVSNNPGIINLTNVKGIVAQVPGHNGEDSWYWILALRNGQFQAVTGSCDYTGWDCQSGIELIATTTTALKACSFTFENDYGREIRKNLVNQLKGNQAYASLLLEAK